MHLDANYHTCQFLIFEIFSWKSLRRFQKDNPSNSVRPNISEN